MFGIVASDDGSSLNAFKVACYDLSGEGPAEVGESFYDDLELKAYTIEEIALQFLGQAQLPEGAVAPAAPRGGASAAEAVVTCAARSTCGTCAAAAGCKWCAGQHECKPARTNEVCTHDYHTVQQCDLQANHADGWFELPASPAHELYVTFHFAPAKSSALSTARNAIGILVGPAKATAGATPVLLEQAAYKGGVQGCRDPLDGFFAAPEMCSFDKEMEITLHVQVGKVSLATVNGMSITTSQFGGRLPTSGWWRLTSKGGAISRVEVVTEEEMNVGNHIKNGATQAVAGASSTCAAGSAACGDSCFSVCEQCGPPRYCMCYENGYYGVSGTFHEGAACLKWDGDGLRVEMPEAGQRGHKAFAEREP